VGSANVDEKTVHLKITLETTMKNSGIFSLNVIYFTMGNSTALGIPLFLQYKDNLSPLILMM